MFYMGIIVNLKDDRSELQRRIAAELQEKNEGGSKVTEKIKKTSLKSEDIDGVEDSAYVSGYAKSKTLNLDKTWLVLIGGVVLVVMVIIVLAMVG